MEEDNFSFLESEPSLLDMSASFNRKESQKKAKDRTIYLIIALGSLTIIEYFTKDYLKSYSNYLFGNSNPNRCYTYLYFDFYSLSGRYFIFFLIYNYINIYAALCIIFLDNVSFAFSNIIKFFCLEPRPFWETSSLFPCLCITDYTGASSIGTNSVILFLSLYRMFTIKSNNKMFKVLFGLMCLLCICVICFIRLKQNVDYLHQIVFGVCLGVAIHVWFYYILKVNVYNKKQFKQLITKPLIVLTLTISCWAIVSMCHFNSNTRTKPKYIVNIQKYCDLNTVYSFDKEAFIKNIQIFEFYGCYLGTWLEYWYTFKGNSKLFGKYNIKSNNEMFNQTGWVASFVRFVLFYLVHVVFVKRIIIDTIEEIEIDSGTFVTTVCFGFLPMMVEGIGFFYVLKRAVVKVKLTNEKIVYGIQDDTDNSMN